MTSFLKTLVVLVLAAQNTALLAMQTDSDKAAWPLLYAAAKEGTGRRPARSRRDHLFTKYHIGVLEAILAHL